MLLLLYEQPLKYAFTRSFLGYYRSMAVGSARVKPLGEALYRLTVQLFNVKVLSFCTHATILYLRARQHPNADTTCDISGPTL